MPVINQGTPTVQVSVPVPTPVQPRQRQPAGSAPQPRKSPKPARTSSPQEDDGGGQPEQVQPQLPPPQPVPRAIILPWAPTGGGKQRMRRLPKRVIKMAKRVGSDASQEAQFHKVISADRNEDLNSLAYADFLEENGKPAHAEVVRGVFKPSKKYPGYKFKPIVDGTESGLKGPRGVTYVHARREYKNKSIDSHSVAVTHKNLAQKGRIIFVHRELPKSEVIRLVKALHAEGANPTGTMAVQIVNDDLPEQR